MKRTVLSWSILLTTLIFSVQAQIQEAFVRNGQIILNFSKHALKGE